MPIVIDTSALIAVIVNEPERTNIIHISRGNTLIGPGSIPWEIGNAFSAMFKQKRINLEQASQGIEIFESIPIRYTQPNHDAQFVSGHLKLCFPDYLIIPTLTRYA